MCWKTGVELTGVLGEYMESLEWEAWWQPVEVSHSGWSLRVTAWSHFQLCDIHFLIQEIMEAVSNLCSSSLHHKQSFPTHHAFSDMTNGDLFDIGIHNKILLRYLSSTAIRKVPNTWCYKNKKQLFLCFGVFLSNVLLTLHNLDLYSVSHYSIFLWNLI